MKQVIATVISNKEVMPGVYLIWLESPQIASVAQPGQFVMVRCGEGNLLRRPLSIHQLANEVSPAKFAFSFAVVGKGTAWLSQRQIGDTVDVLGTSGNGFSIHPDAKKLLLVTGGIGIAPLFFLAQHAMNQGCSVTLLLAASTATQLYPNYLLPLETQVVTATEDGTVGHHGLVTDLLPDFTGWADQIFACGPMPMYRALARKKKELKLEGKSVQVSLEVRMGCGRGVCYGCTVKTRGGLKKVCQDGPVFDLDDILWDELNLL